MLVLLLINVKFAFGQTFVLSAEPQPLSNFSGFDMFTSFGSERLPVSSSSTMSAELNVDLDERKVIFSRGHNRYQ